MPETSSKPRLVDFHVRGDGPHFAEQRCERRSALLLAVVVDVDADHADRHPDRDVVLSVLAQPLRVLFVADVDPVPTGKACRRLFLLEIRNRQCRPADACHFGAAPRTDEASSSPPSSSPTREPRRDDLALVVDVPPNHAIAPAAASYASYISSVSMRPAASASEIVQTTSCTDPR